MPAIRLLGAVVARLLLRHHGRWVPAGLLHGHIVTRLLHWHAIARLLRHDALLIGRVERRRLPLRRLHLLDELRLIIRILCTLLLLLLLLLLVCRWSW